MRLFTAIDIPDQTRDALARLIERLRPQAQVSWNDAQKLHITTKFIGEWPQDRLEEMKAVLGGVGSPGEMEISIQGLGWFPNARHPHILWAGVKASPELAELAHATESALKPIGVAAEERRFSPHLTLARIREHARLSELRSAVEALGAPLFGSFSPAAFHLYCSREGKYTKMAEFPIV